MIKFAIGISVEPKCVAWRQTGGCNPDGPREHGSDKTCYAVIPDGSSGYCECQGGERKMAKGCKKGYFETCADACDG